MSTKQVVGIGEERGEDGPFDMSVLAEEER